MKYQLKQTFLILLIILILGGIAYSFVTSDKEKDEIVKQDGLNVLTDANNNTNEQTDGKTISMCYYRGQKTDRGFYDVSWLSFEINGDKIKGEFQNLPAEKDMKIGKFEGTVGPVIKEKMAREADVIWDSWGEGMNNKEELRFEFGDGSAVVDFGEMELREDGVYVYKNKSIHNYQTQMNQIDCDNLEEKIYMEKYVRDNIASIAKQQAVLGGTWYVLSVYIDPNMNKGEVVYEDGHLQAAADFSYEYSKTSNAVNMTKFEEKKI